MRRSSAILDGLSAVGPTPGTVKVCSLCFVARPLQKQLLLLEVPVHDLFKQEQILLQWARERSPGVRANGHKASANGATRPPNEVIEGADE